MKYEDVLKRFVTNQAQLLQDKQMKQQMRDQMYAEKAKALGSFVPGSGQTPDYGMQSPQEEYTETEHNPFEEGQEYKLGGTFGNPEFDSLPEAMQNRILMQMASGGYVNYNNWD